MDLLLKKTGLPSIEDFAKEIAVKKNLTAELGRSIRVIQEENVGKSVVTDNEYSSNLCSVLEAIFIHGLKDKITRKVSNVFSSNPEKIPEPQFWSAVSNFSHKDVILEINSFNQVTSDVGRGRAWLRAAFNEGLIVSYVSNMLSDKSVLQKLYNNSAYIRDEEQSDIMKTLLEGLNVFTFELSCNSSSLNIWNSMPLTLANVWSPPATPQPVMPAVDVIDFFTDPKNQVKSSPKVKKSSVVECGDVANDLSSSSNDNRVDIESDNGPSNADSKQGDESVPSEDSEKTHITDQNESTVKDKSPSSNNILEGEEIVNCDIPNLEKPTEQNFEEMSSKVSSSDSVPDFGLEIIDDFSDQVGSMGNKLNERSGWSSTFDCDKDSANFEVDQSYDSLLQSYNKNLNKVVIGTPDLADTFTSIMQTNDESSDCSPEAKSPDSDFEFVPKYLAIEHADEETKKLIAVVGKLCNEKGLNLQDFKCNSCGRPIGVIYGKSRLCYYDGYNYCYECHENESVFIPARIVHNWDFSKYPVSKRAKALISRIDKDPLLDIKVLNPAIYTASEEMAQMQLLRTQLTFLRSYIFTCKESVAEDLRKRLWPREYLYEHVHLYSIADLLEIPSGALAQTLQKVIAFAKKHVMSCHLCQVKGFICEVCKNPKVIYPFDVETTYHCEKCLAVYHAACMDANKYCPKCIRIMKRKQLREESTTPD